PAALDLPFREAPNLPCVAIGSAGTPGQTIGLDTAETELIVRSLDCLGSRGCKRVAIIDLPGCPTLDPELALPLAASRGIHIEPYWLLGVNNFTHQTATNIVRLLMSGPADNRPDGLIIANPFLVESSTAGL